MLRTSDVGWTDGRTDRLTDHYRAPAERGSNTKNMTTSYMYPNPTARINQH